MTNVKVNKDSDKRTISIDIEGTFDFHILRDFRNIYRDETADFAYIINLHRAECMDSAALGMLLLLREHAGGDEANITINGCRPNIKKTFKIAQFDQLFKIC